jgi:transposase, IS5 family
MVKSGGVPAHWKPARARQIDREGRWTLKRGRKKPVPPGGARAAAPEIAVPMFGYRNHVGIDRAHRLIRRFTVTHAAAHDGAQLGALLDPTTPQARSGPTAPIARGRTKPSWTGTASAARSTTASPRDGRWRRISAAAMPREGPRRDRARLRTAEGPMALCIRTIGIARAKVKIGLANLISPTTSADWSSTNAARRWHDDHAAAADQQKTEALSQNRGPSPPGASLCLGLMPPFPVGRGTQLAPKASRGRF